jgi:amidase
VASLALRRPHTTTRAIERADDALGDAGNALEEVEVPRLADVLECDNTPINAEFGLAWPRIRPLLTEVSGRHLEDSMRRQPPGEVAGYIAGCRKESGRIW